MRLTFFTTQALMNESNKKHHALVYGLTLWLAILTFFAAINVKKTADLTQDVALTSRAIDNYKEDGLDSTLAIQRLINSNAGGTARLPPGSFRINAALIVPSNTTLCGAGDGTILRLQNGALSGIKILNSSNVSVYDLQIVGAHTGQAPYIGAIHLEGSHGCEIRNVTVRGMTWGGIYINDSNHNTVTRCTFHEWRGDQGDSADIMIYNNSNWNIARENRCYGGGFFGIAIIDPYRNSQPTGNRIEGNIIGRHTAYGILAYVTNKYNTKTVIRDNIVHDITGSDIAYASGTGIYVQSAAGTLVSGNRVSNCCIETRHFGTLAPAGIGVTSPREGFAPIIVADNIVDEMTRGPGIAVQTAGPGVIIRSNTVVVDNTKEATNGHGIVLSNASHVIVSNNHVEQRSEKYAAINCVSFDDLQGIIIQGNQLRSKGIGLGFNRVNQGTFSGPIVQSNNIQADSAALFMGFCSKSIISSNSLSSKYGFPLHLHDSPLSRIAATTMFSLPEKGPMFTGDNNGSMVDRSCFLSSKPHLHPDTGIVVELPDHPQTPSTHQPNRG